MENSTDPRELALKLGKLYEQCLILEQTERVMKYGWYQFTTPKYPDISEALRQKVREKERHQDLYELHKPKPEPVAADEQKFDAAVEIEKERKKTIIERERRYYTPWMMLSVLVTVLCCLATGAIGVMSILKKQNPAGAAAMLFYGIATVWLIYSVVFKNAKSKYCSKPEALASPSPLVPFVLLIGVSVMYLQWIVLAITVVNMLLVSLLMTQPSKKVKAEAKSDKIAATLYSPKDFVPSRELQEKIDRESVPKENIFARQVEEYDKAFQAKLSELDESIRKLEKEQNEEEQQAKARYAAEAEKIKRDNAAAKQAIAEADFLQPEDKTPACVLFLYEELSSGRAENLKQALREYDRRNADGRDIAARLDILSNMGKSARATDEKAKADEARLREIRAKNASLEREIRETKDRLNRK